MSGAAMPGEAAGGGSTTMEAVIERTAHRYVEAAGGDLAAALRIAVADLIDIQDEAEWRRRALDQWVSRGYVRGPAAEVLEMPHIRRVLIAGGG